MSELEKAILVVNAGSSSIKFQLFDLDKNLEAVAKGLVEGIGTKPVAKINDDEVTELTLGVGHKAGMEHILNWINAQGKWEIVAAGHRVVHGGSNYSEPIAIDDEIVEKILELTPLAPLHQPHHVTAIKSLMDLDPGLTQVACFDTSFHAKQEKLHKAFALPKEYYDKGVKRYGFHGLSYEYIASKLEEDYPKLHNGKVVVCHLGNGASVCAIANGKSVDSSMGMSVIEGLPMGTRTGSIDAGAVLHIMEHENKSIAEMNHMLAKESGLLGLSGLSNDMRALGEAAAEGNEDAAFAIEFFTFRIAQVVASMAAAMKGIDAVVFTGGIGENAQNVREKVMERLEFLPNLEMHVIPTNEELMIAKSTQKLLGL